MQRRFAPRTNEADRGVDGFRCKNWRPANAKSFMVHENNPDAACMDGIERTEREQCTMVRGTSHQLSCVVNGCTFL